MHSRQLCFITAIAFFATIGAIYILKDTSTLKTGGRGIVCLNQSVDIGLVDPFFVETLPIIFNLVNETNTEINCNVRTSCGCIATKQRVVLNANSKFDLNVAFHPSNSPGFFRKRVVVEPDDGNRFGVILLEFHGEIKENPSLKANVDMLDFGVVSGKKKRQLQVTRNDGSQVGVVGAECPPGIRLLMTTSVGSTEKLSFECVASELLSPFVESEIKIKTSSPHHRLLTIPVKARKAALSPYSTRAVFIRNIAPGSVKIVNLFNAEMHLGLRLSSVSWKGDPNIQFSLANVEPDYALNGAVRVEVNDSIKTTRLFSGTLDVSLSSEDKPVSIPISLLVVVRQDDSIR